MAESREYISREEELGSVNISEEVLAAIAGAAALDVEGVGALGSGLGSDVAAMVNRKVLSKGVRISVEEDRVSVDISLMVKYGYVVPDVARGVQDAVSSAVENTSGLQVACVNVTVAGVMFQKEVQKTGEPGLKGSGSVFAPSRKSASLFQGTRV